MIFTASISVPLTANRTITLRYTKTLREPVLGKDFSIAVYGPTMYNWACAYCSRANSVKSWDIAVSEAKEHLITMHPDKLV